MRTEFLITKREMVLGRSTDDQKVDIDLADEGNASKVSRQQAFIKLRWNGEFCLRNVGRRPVWINNAAAGPRPTPPRATPPRATPPRATHPGPRATPPGPPAHYLVLPGPFFACFT